jgi:hypothetical protein
MTLVSAIEDKKPQSSVLKSGGKIFFLKVQIKKPACFQARRLSPKIGLKTQLNAVFPIFVDNYILQSDN